MASILKFIWSSLLRICTFDEGAPTTHTTRRVGAPGVPCNPENGVGLLAAVTEPASSYLRIANKPIRTDVHGIMTVAADLCCNGACSNVHCCGTLEASTFHANESCSLCSHRLGGARVYVYMGMMFCTRGCRFDYFMEELYDKRHMELTGMPVGNQISAALKESLVSAEEEESFRKIFFCR